jgi:hypothetical protein
MGWKYSLPFFCAYTETATDLANQQLNAMTHTCPHPLEATINSISVPVDPASPAAMHPHEAYSLHKPLAYSDVDMDDFLGLAQSSTATQTQRAILNSIDAIFRANPLPNDAPNRKAVISQSKLAAGDGTWKQRKVILGWLLDTSDKTLQLPLRKADRLVTIMKTFLPLRRTSRRKWQRLLGELRHLAVAIPGARYLFSILQHILLANPTSS